MTRLMILATLAVPEDVEAVSTRYALEVTAMNEGDIRFNEGEPKATAYRKANVRAA